MMRGINFLYEVVEPKDGSWGRMNSNGTFSGLVGMSQQEISDISVTGMGITAERAKVITFLFPWQVDSSQFAAPLPLDIPKWKSPITKCKTTLLMIDDDLNQNRKHPNRNGRRPN